jgi:hypothetical protein
MKMSVAVSAPLGHLGRNEHDKKDLLQTDEPVFLEIMTCHAVNPLFRINLYYKRL